MKFFHHQFKIREQCNESLNFPLKAESSGSSVSILPALNTSYQRGFTIRLLFRVTYLLSSLSVVYGTCPTSCVCDVIYQSVECDYSKRVNVPKNIPNYTRVVSITNSRITKLTKSDFSHLTSLRMLSLENNSISTISMDSFKSSKKLRNLNLNGNELSSFPQALIGMSKLTELHMQRNSISTLKQNDSVVLQKLQYLNLESNRIYTVTQLFFRSMSKIQTLQMSFNQIQVIDQHWLNPLTNLETLELERSFSIAPPIGSWFSCKSSSALVSLNLAYNAINFIPPRTFSCTPNLTYLSLDNNNVSYLTGDIFSNLSELIQLDLSFNIISRLPEPIFDRLISLRALNLKSNCLRRLPKNLFQGLHNLRYLNLDFNFVKSIEPGVFDNMQWLEELHIQNNELLTIPPRLLYMHFNLIYIDLGFNDIYSLPTDLFKRTSLQSISLNNNVLEELPRFQGLETLQYLNVSVNAITFIASDAFEGTSLSILDISYNNIETIMTLEYLPSLPALILDGNPIKCNCDVKWLYNLPIIDSIKCASPFQWAGEYVYKFLREMDYVPCTEDIDTSFIYKTCVIWFSILFLVMLVYWGNVYYRYLEHWRAWSPTKRRRKQDVDSSRKSKTYYRISNDNFWNNNHMFSHRLTSSFRRVRLSESLQSNEYLETIV